MKFDISGSEFEIVDILKCKRKSSFPMARSNGRSIAVLACRFSGRSEIETEDELFVPDVNNYFLCPENIKYNQRFFDEEMIAIHLKFLKMPPEKPELIYHPSSEIKTDFNKLYIYWIQKKPGYIPKCKSLIYEIFYKLYSAEIDLEYKKIKNSMDYFYSNCLDKNFDIKKMISCSFVSEAYFRRLFKGQYGCTVVEMLNSLRVENAKSLIESKAYSIKEIANMCGFEDEKYFSSVFKKKTGVRPSKYGFF